MSPELAKLIEDYLKGDTIPLISNMMNGPEAVGALRTAQAIATRLETGLSPAMSVQSFDGQFVGIGCERHPPILLPVIGIKVRVPTTEKMTKHTMESAYSLAAKLPDLFCKDCLQERQQESLVTYGQRTVTCVRHKNTLLDERGVCEQCNAQSTNTAINGEPIRFISSEKNLSHYTCPMHGDFSRGHRAKPVCDICHSITGISTYAQSISFNDKAELHRLKRLMAALPKSMREPPKEMVSHKRKLIKDFMKHLLDSENNLHLLHVFPTEALIKGDWLAEHVSLPTSATSHMEYLMANTQARVLPAVALLESAEVFWNRDYRTVHHNLHREANK